jgi:4-hydroxy-3-polyprenylbenzoate decarboxylase
MELLLLAGGILLPPNPYFYSGARTIEELADTVVARVLDHLGVDHNVSPRWPEERD